jgi:hypothetical protein
VKKALDAALRTAIYGSMAAAAAVAAFLFVVIGAFLWAQQRYDTIVACGVGAGLFLLVALIALTLLAISRRRAAKAEAEAAHAVSAWLADPAILLTAAQVVRTVGLARLLPLAVAAVAAFAGVDLLNGRRRAGKRRTEPNQTKRAA